MRKIKLLDAIIKRYHLSNKESTGLIMSGKVLVNDIAVTKTGQMIDEQSIIRIRNQNKYVSRGAYKLLTAFEHFNLNVQNKNCLDAGSSTGGFTQVLLEKGAKRIYAIDCGKNLMDYSLRNNPKIVVMENTRITDLQLNDLNDPIDMAVMDISFTSSIHIIDHLYNSLKIQSIVALIKPQFEYERLVNKLYLNNSFNGVVTNDKNRKKIILEIQNEINNIGLNTYQTVQSSIKGTKGNIEYLFFLGEHK